MAWTGTGTPVSASTYRLVTLGSVNGMMGFTTGEDATRDALITTMLDRATDAIEYYCDRKFINRTYRLEAYDGDGSEWLFLNNCPITRIHRISLGSQTALTVSCTGTNISHASIDITSTKLSISQIGGSGDGTSDFAFASYGTVSAMCAGIDALDTWTCEYTTAYGQHRASDLIDVYGKYCLDQNLYLQIPDTPIYDFTVYKEGGKEMGILHRNAGWSGGTMNIYVTYDAGYTTVPYDVQQACIELITQWYNRAQHDVSLKSERLGDYSYTLGDTSATFVITPNTLVGQILAPWRRLPIVG